MKSLTTSFFVKVSFLLLLYIAPTVLFLALKYNGLQEGAAGLEDQESTPALTTQLPSEPADQQGSNRCISQFKIDNFTENFVGTKENCIGLICRNGECGVRILRGERLVSYSNSPSLLDEVDKAARDLLKGKSDPADNKAPDDGTPDQAKPDVSNVTPTEAEENQEVGTGPGFSVLGSIATSVNRNAFGYHAILWISIISWTLFFSTLGLASSILPRTEQDNLQVRQSRFPIFVMVAAISGIITLSLFAGGFVSGSLFPSFTSEGSQILVSSLDLQFSGADWFKLAVWAYISGFYERFVPNILSTLTSKASPGPDGGDGVNERGKRPDDGGPPPSDKIPAQP